MADEITISTLMTVTKGSLSIRPSAWSSKASMTGTDAVVETMNLTTTPAAIPLGPVTAAGEVHIINLGATNSAVIYFVDGASTGIEIPAGRDCRFRLLTGSELWAKAAASTTQIQVFIIEA